jgi:hypothetical protein
MNIRAGDKVKVLDPGLAVLRSMTGGPPNNLGWAAEIWDSGDILVRFPIGDDDPEEHSQVAPYPAHLVTRYDWEDDERKADK